MLFELIKLLCSQLFIAIVSVLSSTARAMMILPCSFPIFCSLQPQNLVHAPDSFPVFDHKIMLFLNFLIIFPLFFVDLPKLQSEHLDFVLGVFDFFPFEVLGLS